MLNPLAAKVLAEVEGRIAQAGIGYKVNATENLVWLYTPYGINVQVVVGDAIDDSKAGDYPMRPFFMIMTHSAIDHHPVYPELDIDEHVMAVRIAHEAAKAVLDVLDAQ